MEAQRKPAVAVVRCLLLGEAGSLARLPDSQRGCFKISQQLNIVGKRSGEGFVTHKAKLATALSRCMADRITLMDFTIGRKGFTGYIKALSGSNTVKVVPSNNGDKRLKVVCGANIGYIADGSWIKEKTPMVFADVRVSPYSVVNPNIGNTELAEALTRVLPFTADEENRPVLQCVLFKASGGKLTLVGSDGFRLAVVSLDYDEGIEGAVLVHKDDLKGIANALKRARRVNIAFSEDNSLVVDTEAIRYKFIGSQGTFPDYGKIIPTDLNCLASFDSVEAVKAIGSLKAVNTSEIFSIDLTIGEGKMVMTSPDDAGISIIPADTEGQGEIRIDGKYLADVLKACSGMTDLTMTNAYSPMMFSTDGYSVTVMPMLSVKANEQKEQDSKAKAEAEPEAEAQPTAEAQAEAEPKPKRRRSQRKEPVAVA